MKTIIDGVDYGPLACLIGEWQGKAGMDLVLEPDGAAQSPYYESITFDACGDVDNADEQLLAIVRYTQVVSRQSNDKVFHHEAGFYTWEAAAASVVQSFAIPRGIAVVAGGSAEVTAKGIEIQVGATAGDSDWGITEAPFMRDNAHTQSFSHLIRVDGEQMYYEEVAVVQIYGKTFEHTDQNQLSRVVPPHTP